MSIYSELNTKPDFTDRWKFGVIFLVGMTALGAIQRFWLHHDTLATGLFIAAGAVFVLSFVPPIGRLLYIAWMAFGITIGLVTSPIIMFVLYLLLIVPVGLFFKITGRDLMRRKLDAKSDSYWEDYPQAEDPTRYVKQF